jgi:DNA polymerase III epsilon subunit-like protein
MIGSELLRYQDHQRYILFDVETEGLNLGRSKPWQISYAICTNKRIESVVTRYPYYKDLNVSPEAAKITRFDHKSYVQASEDPLVILKDFEQIAMDPSYLILGHNILGFDAYMWQNMRHLSGLKTDWSFIDRMVDTLALSRAYRHQIQPDLNNITAWQYKMLTLRKKGKGFGASLKAMAKEFLIEYDERYSHDAEYDCQVNHQVFQKLIWTIEV